MVLLVSLLFTYQGRSYEDDLKYGDRDITPSSSVFPRSKGGGADGWTTTWTNLQTKLNLLYGANLNKKSKSVHQLRTKGAYIVGSCSLPQTSAR